MVSGTEVAFFETDATGKELCTAPIPVALGVGECMVVSCQADLGGKTVDVFVKVDPVAQQGVLRKRTMPRCTRASLVASCRTETATETSVRLDVEPA
ncbi:MAG: hypothetical protein U0263_03415 [Polyangiaceae bacterium]